MSINYDSTVVGVPYVRAQRIIINYPDAGKSPSATIEQSLAVKMLDGTVRQLENINAINVTFDFANDGSTNIPLVHPDSGLPIGANTTLNNTMLAILAVVRSEQNKAEAALVP
jgi:hypothetical protein